MIRILTFTVLYFTGCFIFAQRVGDTLQQASEVKDHNPYANSREYIEEHNENKGFRPVRWFLGGMMYVYQNVVTDQYFSACIYDPSCSNFSKHSINEFGWIKGIFLSADRLQRCNAVGASYEPYSDDAFSNRRKDTPDRYRIK